MMRMILGSLRRVVPPGWLPDGSHRKAIGWALAVMCAWSAGCGGSPTSPASATPQASSTPQACAGLTLSAAMSDPTGDAGPWGSYAPPDLASFRAAVSGCQLSVTIVFAPGAFSLASTSWSLALDTDEDPATGFSGRNSGHIDPGSMGAEYLVEASATGIEAEVRRSASGGGFAAPHGAVPVTIAGDQVSFVIPLEMLGGDDGRMVLSVTAAIRLTPTTSSPLLDYLPDLYTALPRTR
jgi:hypothetical protein